ncbi:DUF4352 domain-containing protein [Alteribacillus sp. HJP-4]|uniref:DUF4352 domain-containing protein n=1 Tax=Alteribacillus sp. HJP-4 TaxID=2775394 RepID=UPI0035CCE967
MSEENLSKKEHRALKKARRKWYMKKRSWLGGIIALIIIISVVANMGNEEAATEPESNDEDATAVEAEASETEGAEEEPAETAGIGEEVEVGDIAFTVNEVSEQSEIEDEFLDTLTTEGKFVVVDLTVNNNDSEARFIDGEMFRLLGSEETEYKSSIDADMYLNDDIGFFLEEVNPNMSTTGKIAFEIPADESYKLQVSSGLGWSGGKYSEIEIQE